MGIKFNKCQTCIYSHEFSKDFYPCYAVWTYDCRANNYAHYKEDWIRVIKLGRPK